MKKWILKFWRTFSHPATKISLGVLTIGGFIAGIIFWIGFNTALDVTNTEKFCISCHTMRDTTYKELQQTVHWSNHSGVRATCPDCHVPHNWTDKIARKIQASKEVYGQIFGTIDTPQKWEAKRLELAQHEWERFTANSSKECKDCHKYESMQLHNLKPAARLQMQQAAIKNQSCIDCHKGIAHKLPEQMDSSGGLISELESKAHGTKYRNGELLYTVNFVELFTDRALKDPAGLIEPATQVKVLEENKDSMKILISGWRKMKGFGRVVYEDFGLNILSAELSIAIAKDEQYVRTFEQKADDMTGLNWQKIDVELWVRKANFTADIAPVWAAAKQVYDVNCALCHTQPAEAHFDANMWPSMFDGMMGFVNFDGATQSLVLKYLQKHSSTFVDDH